MLYITFTATDDGIRDLDTRSRLELLDERENGQTGSGTKVEDLNLVTVLGVKHPVDSLDMRLGEVHYIDIIADTGSVRRIIIITEDFELGAHTRCRLGDKRQQILGNAVRQFSYQSRRMGTNRVKITQDSGMQIPVSVSLVANNLFVDLLGVAVRRESFLDRSRLINRKVVGIRLTIYRTRGREDQVLHLMELHDLQKGNEAAQVIAIIEERLLYRLSYCFRCCKMNDAYDIRILLEYVIHIHKIAAVHIGKVRSLAYDFLYSLQHINRGVAEIIHDCHLIACLHQFNRGV